MLPSRRARSPADVVRHASRIAVAASDASGLRGGCDDANVFEYGGGISEGPGGQVGGTGNGGGGNLDLGAQLMDGASSAVRTVTALPAEQLLLLLAAIFIAVWVLRRAL